MLILLYVAFGLAALAILLAIVLFVRLNKQQQTIKLLTEQLQRIDTRQEPLEKRVSQLKEWLHEVRAGGLGMGNRVKELEQQLAELRNQQVTLSDKQVEMEHQEASTPLYTLAAKLVASGASVEEIMQECDLPRAEAELLISLHRQSPTA